MTSGILRIHGSIFQVSTTVVFENNFAFAFSFLVYFNLFLAFRVHPTTGVIRKRTYW